MRVPIYCGETFEALTIIRLRPWALELLDQGCVFLRFAPLGEVRAVPGEEEPRMVMDVCTVRFDPLRLRDMRTWIGVTDDGVTALRLRSVFLPGQQSEVNEVRRDAQLQMIESALRGLGRRG